MYWFSVKLSFGVLSLARGSGLKTVFLDCVFRIRPKASWKTPQAIPCPRTFCC